MKTIEGKQFQNKTILVRVDFNVPQDANGKILDDTRIKASLETIKYLLEQNAKIVLISHFGRPAGKIVENLKLNRVAERLKELLDSKNQITQDNLNSFPAYRISENIILLENIRFYKEEEENDHNFAKKLSDLGDFYVNDAFSASDGEEASLDAITHFLPSFAGLLLEKEYKKLTELSKNPKHPFVCVLGGAKAEDKIGVIENLAKEVDWFLFGGVIANTFLAASGIEVRDSLIAKDKLDLAKKFMKEFGEKIILPSQVVFGDLEGKRMILDIGKTDVDKFAQYISKAKTVFWNGNLGMTEKPEYAKGSEGVVNAIVKNKDCTSIVAGGDTISFINQIDLISKFSFVSLGGGATLEFLAGKEFKALKSLV